MEKFGVYTDMELTMAINHLSPSQKQALAEALYMLNGIEKIDMTITLIDGTTITPKIVNWEHEAEDISVFNDDDEILQLENI